MMNKYFYEQAVKYLESKGVSCDATTTQGEYVCDKLDAAESVYDEVNEESYYTKATLDKIIKQAHWKYLLDSEEVVILDDDESQLEKVNSVLAELFSEVNLGLHYYDYPIAMVNTERKDLYLLATTGKTAKARAEKLQALGYNASCGYELGRHYTIINNLF